MKNFTSLKVLSIFLNVLLIIQYVLGMAVNLFVNLNNVAIPGSSFLEKVGMSYAYVHAITTNAYLQAHFYNACLLLLVAIIILILGIKNHLRYVWIYSIIILVALFLAANSGAAFLASGQNNYYSLTMAFTFLISFGFSLAMSMRIFYQKW